MKHDYNDNCQCYRCKGIRNDPRRQAAPRPRRTAERRASREEQQARYLDCGPQNWDDR